MKIILTARSLEVLHFTYIFVKFSLHFFFLKLVPIFSRNCAKSRFHPVSTLWRLWSRCRLMQLTFYCTFLFVCVILRPQLHHPNGSGNVALDWQQTTSKIPSCSKKQNHELKKKTKKPKNWVLLDYNWTSMFVSTLMRIPNRSKVVAKINFFKKSLCKHMKRWTRFSFIFHTQNFPYSTRKTHQEGRRSASKKEKQTKMFLGFFKRENCEIKKKCLFFLHSLNKKKHRQGERHVKISNTTPQTLKLNQRMHSHCTALF